MSWDSFIKSLIGDVSFDPSTTGSARGGFRGDEVTKGAIYSDLNRLGSIPGDVRNRLERLDDPYKLNEAYVIASKSKSMDEFEREFSKISL